MLLKSSNPGFVDIPDSGQIMVFFIMLPSQIIWTGFFIIVITEIIIHPPQLDAKYCARL